MKKEICLTAVVLLLASSSMAYAGNSSSAGSAITSGSAVTSGSSITTGSAVATTTVIKLSLKDAVKIMQTTGTRAETAELNKKADQAIALGYGDSIYAINRALDKLSFIDTYAPSMSSTAYSEAVEAGATKDNREILRLQREFANSQIDPNYKAEMNQIEYDTLKVYNGVLLAQDNLKTEQDNVKTQEDILKNTKAQYIAGMLPKKDVLSAQSALTSAKSSAQAAETKLEYAKMSFNYLLGYSATQEVTFTDKLDVVSAPAIELDASVKNAIANRNEIKGVNFAVKVHKVLLKNLESKYPKTAAVYIKQQVAVLNAENSAKNVPVQIEIDIRNKAAELEDKKAALEAAKAVQAYAQEGYRLVKISYDAGMTTLAELQQIQVNVYKAGLGVSAATSEYDLAVYTFRYAQDVGTYRLSL